MCRQFFRAQNFLLVLLLSGVWFIFAGTSIRSSAQETSTVSTDTAEIIPQDETPASAEENPPPDETSAVSGDNAEPIPQNETPVTVEENLSPSNETNTTTSGVGTEPIPQNETPVTVEETAVENPEETISPTTLPPEENPIPETPEEEAGAADVPGELPPESLPPESDTNIVPAEETTETGAPADTGGEETAAPATEDLEGIFTEEEPEAALPEELAEEVLPEALVEEPPFIAPLVQRLKDRRLDREIKIDSGASHKCEVIDFNLDVSNQDLAVAEMILDGDRENFSKEELEIGNLPPGIDMTFLGSGGYKYSPTKDENSLYLQVTKEENTLEGNFNLSIIYTGTKENSDSITLCQINVINL